METNGIEIYFYELRTVCNEVAMLHWAPSATVEVYIGPVIWLNRDRPKCLQKNWNSSPVYEDLMSELKLIVRLIVH